MDNNSQINNLSVTEISIPKNSEQNYKSFVPKIRIRLRPKSGHMKNIVSENVFDTSITTSECGNIMTENTATSDYINTNRERKCYKMLEDSGGGGDETSDNVKTEKDHKHSYMLHGINLRARLPKPLILSKKTKKNVTDINDDKRKSYHLDKEFISQPHMKSICVKNSYKSFMHNSSKNHRIKEPSKRKFISKVRNEILENINLKDIINQENFLKLSSDIQWQLANLLPSCDKPKSSGILPNCHCSDTIYTNNEHQKINPTVTLNALNNEFIGKALIKYSLRMGQSDLINLITSERENLRSRPVSILSDEVTCIDLTDTGVKIEENIIKKEEIEDFKRSDDLKSNSSVCSTETMEMNGTGNLFENISLKIEQSQSGEIKFDDTCDMNYFTERLCDVNEIFSSNEKDSTEASQCDMNVNIMNTNAEFINEEGSSRPNDSFSPDGFPELNIDSHNAPSHLSIDTGNICFEIKPPEVIEDKRRKRGRKRKCLITSNDVIVVPVKRSNRSTAGKRPARLDSESPPTSPNQSPVTDKKSIPNKGKKQTERTKNHRKCKAKHDNSSDELENILKKERKSKKRLKFQELSNYSKICPSSPESLPIESDFSPLSKPSPNGSSLLGSFCRSSLVSLYNDKKSTSHVNSVQALSPSWSCTSESTTPSIKSDYGHVQPTITSPAAANSSSCNIESIPLSEPETKSIQGMPPPRETLTLAAMREKMRAKKLAKEDNRKDDVTNHKRSSSINNSKNKKQTIDCISLLKEGDDDIQMMDKMMSSSEEFDELLNNNQDSLLKFFMGDDNYDFETTVDLSSNTSTSNSKPCNQKKRSKSFSEKDNIPINNQRLHSEKAVSNCAKKENNYHHSKSIINKCSSTQSDNDSAQLSKSIADTIATVLQKLNSSKENGINTSNSVTKTSVPNAYLVDGNGLSSALSIIQSLNPGAKVTTQQFYLVNSGPQLILQPSPPAIPVDKFPPVSVNNKVSLAPKLAVNQPSIVRQQSILSSPTDSMSLNQLTFNKLSPVNNITSESLLRNNNCLKMAISTESPVKNTYMMSSINPHNISASTSVNHTNSLHLQTISTPHPIGLVHSVQPPIQSQLPSLFSSQLRFLHQSPLATNQNPSNTISLIAPNIPSVNSQSQSPKLLFLCPTVGGGGANQSTNIVANSNVLNNQNDQKYLLLSKQPDKQATIQLVSSQGLWQQLNPNMISQANNLLVMQSQAPAQINPFESLLCSNQPTLSLSDQNRASIDSSSSLIIDSRSLIPKLTTDDDQNMVVTSSYNHVVKQTNTPNTISHFYGYDESSNGGESCVVINHLCQDISPT